MKDNEWFIGGEAVSRILVLDQLAIKCENILFSVGHKMKLP